MHLVRGECCDRASLVHGTSAHGVSLRKFCSVRSEPCSARAHRAHAYIQRWLEDVQQAYGNIAKHRLLQACQQGEPALPRSNVPRLVSRAAYAQIGQSYQQMISNADMHACSVAHAGLLARPLSVHLGALKHEFCQGLATVLPWWKQRWKAHLNEQKSK